MALRLSKPLDHTVISHSTSPCLQRSRKSSARTRPSMVSISLESESTRTHLAGSTKFDIAQCLLRRPNPPGQVMRINFGRIFCWVTFRSIPKTSLTWLLTWEPAAWKHSLRMNGASDRTSRCTTECVSLALVSHGTVMAAWRASTRRFLIPVRRFRF